MDATEYPVPYGQTVTQRHTDLCQRLGHAEWMVDGRHKGICPRCGEVTYGWSEEILSGECWSCDRVYNRHIDLYRHILETHDRAPRDRDES